MSGYFANRTFFKLQPSAGSPLTTLTRYATSQGTGVVIPLQCPVRAFFPSVVEQVLWA